MIADGVEILGAGEYMQTLQDISLCQALKLG